MATDYYKQERKNSFRQEAGIFKISLDAKLNEILHFV